MQEKIKETKEDKVAASHEELVLTKEEVALIGQMCVTSTHPFPATVWGPLNTKCQKFLMETSGEIQRV